LKKDEANQKNFKSKDSSKEINSNNFGLSLTAETTNQNSYNFNGRSSEDESDTANKANTKAS